MSHGGGDSGRWLVSYADLITLMMALFLVLYTMGQVDIARYRALAEAFRDALDGKGGIPASVVDAGINPDGAGTGESRPNPVNPDEGVPARTVFHCFTGDAAMARRCLDLGARLSFSGIVTFRSSDDLRAAASICPLDRLLVETDSPYLAPVPHRGRPNEPSYVRHTAEKLAELRGIPFEQLARETTANFGRLFAKTGIA